MKTAGIICEYNPFHPGHARQIELTKKALGGDACIVCAMSGSFVQRGDVAVYSGHARAKMAVLCGADLVIAIPAAYSLQSAQGFAEAGVHLLDSLGICTHISFGSESGSIRALKAAARAINTVQAQIHIKSALGEGLPYAAAQQRAADALLGGGGGGCGGSNIFKSPNNVLGIEYIKALEKLKSPMCPVTVKRTGGGHDSDTGCCGAALRKMLHDGISPAALTNSTAALTSTAGFTPPAAFTSAAAAGVMAEETALGRGPVFLGSYEQAIMSRLRNITVYNDIPGASDGLGQRFAHLVPRSSGVAQVLGSVKTKRFAMSRVRRVLMCAVLGITCDDIKTPPPCIRVLAMNRRGAHILKTAAAKLPVITKPAAARRLDDAAVKLFECESRAADFYALGYQNPEHRAAGSLWRTSPVVV